jgi:hypothetical protein
MNQLPYELIESDRDLEQMLTERNAFVFVKKDWISSSAFAQLKVDEFAIDWSRDDRKPSVKFYLLDTTESEGEDRTLRWADTDRKLTPLYSERGVAIWVRDGNVLKVMLSNDCKRVDLREQTEALFRD